MALVEINWRPDRRRLRGFGLAAVVAFSAIGAWIFWRHRFLGLAIEPAAAEVAAGVLWALAGLCGVLAVAAPAGLRPLYLGLALVGLPMGWVVSHAVLALVYYGVVTPIGVVMRLLGRDPLHRRFEPNARTYWVRRETAADTKRYFRLF